MKPCSAPGCTNMTANNLYCSRSCAARVNNAKSPKRKRSQVWCACGALVRSATTTVIMCRRCSADERRRRWLEGEDTATTPLGYLAQWARDYIWEEAKGACVECGWRRVHPLTGKPPLQIDHVDGNSKNNLRSNLKLVCPGCHALTLTWGAFNRVDGRRKYGLPERHPDAGRPERQVARERMKSRD